jgi:putative transposase
MAEAVWSMDFTADQLVNGHRMRLLTVVDVSTLESLAIEFGPRLWPGEYAAAMANRGQRYSG